MTRIRLTIGDAVLQGTLDDTVAGRDLASLLPLELEVSDFHGIEKVADLPRPLDTASAPAAYAASVGDITTYAPWGNLAIFYKPFRSAPGLVRLGELDGDVSPLLRSGDFRVRIEPLA